MIKTLLKIIAQSEELKMADFIIQYWKGYQIRVRPSDHFRSRFGSFGFDWMILYFNSSDINFDLTITIPNDELHQNIEDTIEYDWVLCDGNNNPLQTKTLGGFSFFMPFGEGKFHFATDKKSAKALIKSGEMSRRAKTHDVIGIRKNEAIRIGRLTRAADYNFAMKFKSSDGKPGEYVPMASFTIFIRDRFIQALWLGVIVVLATTFVTLILRVCGI